MPYASQSAYVAISVAYSLPSDPLKETTSLPVLSFFLESESMRYCMAFWTV